MTLTCLLKIYHCQSLIYMVNEYHIVTLIYLLASSQWKTVQETTDLHSRMRYERFRQR